MRIGPGVAWHLRSSTASRARLKPSTPVQITVHPPTRVLLPSIFHPCMGKAPSEAFHVNARNQVEAEHKNREVSPAWENQPRST